MLELPAAIGEPADEWPARTVFRCVLSDTLCFPEIGRVASIEMAGSSIAPLVVSVIASLLYSLPSITHPS
jgi:hypothetical protein